jgi:hypothetical protein
MFIGEVVETGVIEPVVFSRVVPTDESVPSTTETEDRMEPAAAV